jgi:O-acetyl-ADP-ribose deacetylase (regulator of RNase III)
LLIALFPVFLIFSFFPTDSRNFSGNLLGFSMSGAIGAFIFLFWFGTNKTRAAVDADNLVRQNEELKKQLTAIRDHPVGDGKLRTPTPLRESGSHLYKVKGASGKKIGLITGDIRNVRSADIWVSSENTNMQMARFFDRSVSAVIRYHGAKKDEAGDVVEDVVANELARLRGNKLSVQPATVFATTSGELLKSNNVKKIFHVAAVRGEVGVGYREVHDLEGCVTNALCKAEEFKDDGYTSILFPLLGTGTARGSLKEIAQRLIDTALSYLENNRDASLQTVYFLTWSDIEFETCQEILQKHVPRLLAA